MSFSNLEKGYKTKNDRMTKKGSTSFRNYTNEEIYNKQLHKPFPDLNFTRLPKIHDPGLRFLQQFSLHFKPQNHGNVIKNKVIFRDKSVD